jgi:hypothetical protein
LIRAVDLLDRAVQLISDPSKTRDEDPTFWRDYFAFSGLHMICIEEGRWESGESKAQLIEDYGIECILDEVNPPEERWSR